MDSTSIDRSSPLPVWAQIAEVLRRRIDERGSEVGSLSDEALSREFGVSPVTARQAVQDLVKRGLVTRHRGRGTFVVPRSQPVRLHHFEARFRSWHIKDAASEIRVIERTRIPATLSVAAELRVEPGTVVGFVRRAREVGGSTIGVEYRWLPPPVDKLLSDGDLRHDSLWALLEGAFGMVGLRAETVIRAAGATADEAELMGVPIGSPVLQRGSQVINGEGECVLSGHSSYHQDWFIVATSLRHSGPY
jgi:GntR family transcriptional regulator